MDSIELGKTGLSVSCIGLGTMYFGSKVKEADSFSILDYYISRGGSFLDTANKYASWLHGFRGGESETLIGNWLTARNNRSDLFIASKVGFPYGDIPRSLKRDIIISECEKSLKRLKVETIDLYYAHAYDEETSPEEFMEAFFQLKKSGKIRYAGASNFHAWQLLITNQVAESSGWEGFCCLQQRHTYLEPSLRANFNNQVVLSPDTTKFCRDRNITIIAYSPLLAGAYSKKGFPIPAQYHNQSTDKKLSTLSDISREFGVSANAVVLAWMIQGTPPVIPLVAASSTGQLEENLEALSVVLQSSHKEKLNLSL